MLFYLETFVKFLKTLCIKLLPVIIYQYFGNTISRNDILLEEIMYLLGSDTAEYLNIDPSHEIIHNNDQVLFSPFRF